MVTRPLSNSDRIASVLFALGGDASLARGGLSAADVAKIVGRERTQIWRLLERLVMSRLIERAPGENVYRVNYRALLPRGDELESGVISTAESLQALATSVGETSMITVRSGNRTLTVQRAESVRSLQAGFVGRVAPLHVTAAGRALLFDTNVSSVSLAIADDLVTNAYGPKAPTALPAVIRKLGIERHQGFSVSVDELEPDHAAVATPIRNRSGVIVGAVGVAGPTHRMDSRVKEIGRAVVSTSQQLSLRLPPIAGGY